MSKAGFYIVYDGPALEGSQMDVADLAPALLSLRALLHEANTVLEGSAQNIQLKVRATFQTGCFGIDLIAVQSIVKDVLDFFASDEVNGAFNLLITLGFIKHAGNKVAHKTKTGLLQTIKWIKGRKIDKVLVDEEGAATILIDDEQLRVEAEIIKLLQNQKVRESVEKLIYKPLEQEGIDSFATTLSSDDMENALIINKPEREYYISPPAEDEPLEDVEYDATYELISPVFQEDNKWRMSDGSVSFHVEMLDKDFIGQVQNSEIAFAKGDLLTLKITESKVITASGLKTVRKAMKVAGRRSRARQLPLPIEPASNEAAKDGEE